MTTLFSRRVALWGLAGIGAAALQACATPGPPLPAGEQSRFRIINVDTSALAENGDTASAAWLSHELPGLLQTAFAAHMAPGDRAAYTLNVSIDQVSLGSWSASTDLWGSRPTDTIHGVAKVVGPNGAVLGSYPLLAAGQTTIFIMELGTEELTHRRVVEMGQSFAYWLPRQMGL